MRVLLLLCLLGAVAYAQECGDGIIDVNEECDDGNVFDDDGCSALCEMDARFVCRGEPSECLPIVPDTCLPPPQERPTQETTTVENPSTTEDRTTDSTRAPPTSSRGPTTTSRAPTTTTRGSGPGNCPPIACPSDCDFGTHKYKLGRDSDGCQFCRCVLRRVPLDDNGNSNDDDDGNDRNRRAPISSTTENPTTTTAETTTILATTSDLFTTTENPPTTDDGQCPVNPVFVTNCTCLPDYRVFWEFIGDCPTCHCVPIEEEKPVDDICVGDTTTFGENCTCNEECHACQWDGESGDCLVCTTLFLFRGRCFDECPPGTEPRGNEDYRRRCVVARNGTETTTEATTTAEETTTIETTTAETTTAETTTAETTTVETTTAETTTAETTTAETTTAETTTEETTTGFNSTTEEVTTDVNTTTIVIPLCNGVPDPLICFNFTLNCTDIIGNITVNETCPIICGTCNETTTTTTVVITTTTAAPAAIVEGAGIANNVAAASNGGNPGLIVGMSVLAVVLVAAAVGLVVHRRRQRRHNNEDEIVVGPPEVRVEAPAGQARS